MNSATQRYKSTWIRLIYMQISSEGLVDPISDGLLKSLKLF